MRRFFLNRFRDWNVARQLRIEQASRVWWNPRYPLTSWERFRGAGRSINRFLSRSASTAEEEVNDFHRTEATDFMNFTTSDGGSSFLLDRIQGNFHLPRHIDFTPIDEKNLVATVTKIDKKIVTNFNGLLDSLTLINRDVSKKIHSQTSDIQKISSELNTVLMQQRQIYHEFNKINLERRGEGRERTERQGRPETEGQGPEGLGILGTLLGYGAGGLGAYLGARGLGAAASRFAPFMRTPLTLGLGVLGLGAYGAYQYFRNRDDDRTFEMKNPNINVDNFTLDAETSVVIKAPRVSIDTRELFLGFTTLEMNPAGSTFLRNYLRRLLLTPDPGSARERLRDRDFWEHPPRLDIPPLPELETEEDRRPPNELTTPDMLTPRRERRTTPPPTRRDRRTPPPTVPPSRREEQPPEPFSELPPHLRPRVGATGTDLVEETERTINQPFQPRTETGAETPPSTGERRTYTLQPNDSNVDYLMRRLMSEGLTRYQAAGIVGNLQAETGHNINLGVIGDQGTAFGLAQWRGDRWTALQRFARERELNPNSLETQTEFLIHEARNRRTLDANTGEMISDWDRVRRSRTAEEAATVWDRYYERSSGAHRRRRIENAETLAERDYRAPEEGPRTIGNRGISSGVEGITLDDSRNIFDGARVAATDITGTRIPDTTTIPPSGDRFGSMANDPRYLSSSIRRRGERGEFNYGGTTEGREEFGPPGRNLRTVGVEGGRRVTMHSDVADSTSAFLNDLQSRGYRIGSLGGYNPRNIRGTGRLSQHGHGLAFDINPSANPHTREGRVQTDLPENAERLGWLYRTSWGGRFGDAMHFEVMSRDLHRRRLQQLVNEGFINQEIMDYALEHGRPPPNYRELLNPDQNRRLDRDNQTVDDYSPFTERDVQIRPETLEERYERETGRRSRLESLFGSRDTQDFTRWKNEQLAVPGITLEQTRQPNLVSSGNMGIFGNIQMENPELSNFIPGGSIPPTILNPNLLNPDTILPETSLQSPPTSSSPPPSNERSEQTVDDYSPFTERDVIIAPTHNPENQTSRVTSGYGNTSPNTFEQE